ncbi:class IV adenylate cyclase [Candidatus Woesearchaeota archaeon]|nr:class IV adenylate cyclase [Candidatus Woesearchaeota archaeon]
MREIEVLVELSSSKEDALRALKSFREEGNREVVDTYYFHPSSDDLKPVRGSLRNCLRIREKSGTCLLAYKNDHFDGEGKWVYSDEYEVVVSEGNTMKTILRLLGFRELLTIRNRKHKFMHDQYEIVLEEVTDLGLFLEVERLDVPDSEDASDVKSKIRAFIASLGLEAAELDMGKPELMLKRMGSRS